MSNKLPVEPWVLDRMETTLKARFPNVGKVKIGYQMKQKTPQLPRDWRLPNMDLIIGNTYQFVDTQDLPQCDCHKGVFTAFDLEKDSFTFKIKDTPYTWTGTAKQVNETWKEI